MAEGRVASLANDLAAALPVNPLRVLALVEATTVTGPAKNLIRFCQMIQADPAAGLTISIAAFHRRARRGFGIECVLGRCARRWY